MPSRQRPEVPVEHADEKLHRRVLAQRVNASLATDGSVTMSQTTPKPYRAVTATYTVVLSDYYVNCTSGTFTVTGYTAAGTAGREWNIKNSGTGTITFAPAGSETIDGETDIQLVQYDSITIVSDGENLIII